jgi:origin recognition complex subunit 1
VNGMKVASPHDVYSLLYHRLSGRKAAPATAIKRLDRHFQGGDASRPCVLVLDEVDALLGGSAALSGRRNHQSVLYRLLEWPATAPLSIIAIANTMDLPERQLGGRLASRLGMQRVNFAPYTYPQLMRILERRFGGDTAITADALEYCARKVRYEYI